MNSISRLTGGRLNIMCIVTMMVLSSILIMTPIVERVSAGQDNWWNSSWAHRVLITFNASQIQGSHTNFPVLVIINSTLASKSDNGNSSRFVAYWDNSTALNAELEGTWNNSGNNIIWLNMTHFDSSSHYKVWYYYNCSSAAASWNGAGVWNSNYVMVQHLDESPANDVAGHLDSTSNHNNATPKNFDSSSESTTNGAGQIGGADVFDGTNDGVSCDNSSSLNPDYITITAWVKADSFSHSYNSVVTKEQVDSGGYAFLINSSGKLAPYIYTNNGGYLYYNGSGIHTLSTGTWYHIAITYNGSSLIGYVNGVLDNSTSESSSTIKICNNNLYIAESSASNRQFDGTIDEVRISNIARSADWISTSYNIQNNPSSFMGFGSEQTVNHEPSVSSQIPSDETTNISVPPSYFNITISDAEGETMNITWQTNESGSWSTFNATTSVNNGTYTAINTSWVNSYNTTYWWRVLVNDSNVNWNNQTFSFTTRVQYIPNGPSNFTVTTHNRTQLNLSWTQGNKADKTYIEWNTTETWSRGSGTGLYNDTGTSYQHTNLSFGTPYYYQVWSWNNTDSCWSTTNSSDSNTTASNTIPSLSGETPTNGSTDQQRWPVCNVTVSDADDDSIDVSFYYENVTGSWVLQQTNSSVASGTSVVWSNFTNASDFSAVYNWSVNVTDGYGWTNETYNFTTLSEYVPDPPSSFSASASSSSQIDLLSWTKGNKADYTRIQRKTGGYPTSISDGTNVYNSTGTSKSDTGLSASTTYYYRAWSWNSTGNYWSILNSSTSATTESSGGAPPEGPGGGDTTPPTTPTNVRCTTPEADDTPSFAWDAATDSSGISGYYVKIDNGTDIEVGDVLTWTSADNVEDGNHTFYVKAKDASSNGNIGSYGSCSFTIDTIEGADPPIAVANGPYTGLTFQIISFDGSDSHDVGGTITNYTWDFGDGASGYSTNPTHIYNLSGTYTIALTVTDSEGLTDSDTTTATIKLDSDGDGWSDDMENSYGTNATDPTDQLKDTDGDGISDDDSPDGNYTGDPDDDDDGLNDEIEEKLGSDPKNATDVKSLDMEGNYIIDIDGDGQHDKFYNATSKINTTIEVKDDGTYLIDSNGNGKWDYTYDPKSGEILTYETQEPKREFPWLLIIIGTITAIVVIIFLLFKTGFLYVEEKKPEE